ncbi:sensor histidine kinase [uncultured Lactobacillus sp.]|uniref:sensor histidine kinase n=1 Tax=uncultured Lactobacillus sp. TaxID=153152 RepID=UPI00260DE07D|nr:GHKL domain-containing protein [uncultured Lactobacillus sp.]
MFLIFTYLLYFFSAAYQLLLFYRLNEYKLQSKDILKIILILGVSLIIPDFLLSQVVFLVLVVCLYARKQNLIKTISTILFASLLTYAADLFLRLIIMLAPAVAVYLVPITLIYFGLVYVLTEKLKLYQLFARKNNYLLLGLIAYAFIALHVIGLVIMRADQDMTGILITGLLLFIQFLFMIYAFNVQNKIFERNLKNELEQERERNLEVYLQNLEYSEERLRRFKHDYQNLLLSLRSAAKSDNTSDLLKKLDNYSKTELDSGSFEKFKDLTRIKNLQIKSLLISKINEIKKDQISFRFECTTVIDNLSELIDPFDLSRILGIVFDNAIEASKNNPEGEIKAYMFQDKHSFSFEIENKMQDKVKISEIKKAGVSTKENHQGLGLSNIEQIKQKYPNLFINYQVKQDWFIFSLNIVGDESSENV